MIGQYNGQKTFGAMHSIDVDGDYYGTGPVDVEAELGIKPGDQIEFTTVQRGKYTNVDPKSVKKVSSGEAPKAPSSGGKMSKNDYWENKAEDDKQRQLLIEQQSSRNAAINMVDVLLKNSMMSTPSKKGDQYDFCINLVDKITAKFNSDLELVEQYGLPTGSSLPETQEVTDELEG